jgi:undecaprenyl-diphosphatase
MLVGCGGSFSFPSNHAVSAFAVAAIFSHFFKKAAPVMFIFAILVAFSRVYVGVHYPSAITAGAVWGGSIAGMILLLNNWSVKNVRERPYTTALVVTLCALTFFRYYYLATGPIGLGPDEAHYWEWSRRLDLSYYSKGPLIAYLIAFSTWVMGNTVFAVRFFAPLFFALGSLCLYLLGMELFRDERRASAAALVYQVIPLFSVYGIVNTTDAPLLFFWTLSLYLFWKAIHSNTSRGTRLGLNTTTRQSSIFNRHHLSIWLLLGCAVGLGLLAKYTMAFFYVCMFLFFVTSRDRRAWLRKKEFYAFLLISLVIFSPVVIWNAQHDWVILRHAVGQSHMADGMRISIQDLFEFIGSQIGVVTPLLFFPLMYGAIRSYTRQYRSPITSFLFWFWVPVLCIYLVKSVQGKVQANWALVAYITPLVASADYYLKDGILKKSKKVFFCAALLLAFSVTAVAHYPAVLNLPGKVDPSSRLRGWKELGIKVGKIYDDMASRENSRVFVFSDRYQVSSELAFYMPGNPVTYCVNLGRRMNQYDIWEGFYHFRGYDAVFVRMGNRDFPDDLSAAFDSYEKELFVVKEGGRILREYSIFKSYGFHGLTPGEINSY